MVLGLVVGATYRDDLPTDAVSGDETCGVSISLNVNSTSRFQQLSRTDVPMRSVRAAAAMTICSRDAS